MRQGVLVRATVLRTLRGRSRAWGRLRQARALGGAAAMGGGQAAPVIWSRPGAYLPWTHGMHRVMKEIVA